MKWWLWEIGAWATLPLELVAATIVAQLDTMCLWKVANPLRHVTARYINWYLSKEPEVKHESIAYPD